MNIRSFNQFTPQIAQRVFIDDTALVIGEVAIGENSSVWPMTVIRGDVNAIQIGKGTSIQDGSIVHVTHKNKSNPEGYPCTIGDYVTVGHKAIIHGCAIGNQCLIGMGSIIMDGAIIEDNVILGAGSLVPPGKVLSSGFLWVGTPAKKVRKLTEQELGYLRYSADNYVKLKELHLSNGG